MISLKYQDETPMTDHLNTFQCIINQLAGMNIKFEEEVQGLWLLGTLPNSWETFRTSLSNLASDGTMNMDLVKSCVLNEEMRRKSQSSSSQSDVLDTEKKGMSKSGGPKNRDRSKSKTNKFANVECHYCHLKGHIRKYYCQLKIDMKREKTSWVIDSSVSIHATHRKDFFTSYTSGDFGSVRIGNDGSAKAIGMEDVCLETSNGTMLILKNVKHIPDIRMNLISIGKLDDEWLCNTFCDSQWKLTRCSMVVAKRKKCSSLYLMHARVIDSSINAVDDDSIVELWHNRLGHMSKKGLMILAKKNLLSGMKKGYLKRCAHCLAGKQHGIRHQKTPLKTPQMNGLVERMNRTLVERDELGYKFYGQDELGYKFYDPVQKKLVRSRDVMFVEDHTIQDIEKTDATEFQYSDNLIDLDPVPLTHLPTQVEDEAHDDQHDIGDVETLTQVEMDNGVHEQSPVAEASPDIPFRRSTRDRHPSIRYFVDDYVLLTDGEEPESYEEAMRDENKIKWVDAMQDEMKSLHENHSYELVKLPKGKRALKNRWVYRVKQEEHTSQPRYKARLVVKGFSQKKCIDFDKIFSPIVKMPSIRVVLGLTTSLDLEIEQMDVKTVFLHGDLDKEIYMEQAEGFIIKGKEDYVCKLKKSLYGLKQALRQWYKKFESVMGKQGYKKTTSDHYVFVQKFSDDDFVILLFYVDDILIVGRNVSRIDKLKKQFNMSKAKVVSSPLANHFKLSSRHNPSIDKEKEDMRKVLYASIVGSLMYVMVCTRPDIAYAVGVVSRFLSNPGRLHWEAVKWIMRYLRGTSKLKLTFGSGKPVLVGYTDSNMVGDVDNRRSTSGYLMTFSGGVVSWQSRLQKCVALSTTETEYIVAAKACKELLWMKRFIHELGLKQQHYVVYCDNQSTIHLSKNSTFHARSKHIDVRYHWMRDVLNDNLFEFEKIHTNHNDSDMLTKSLPREKLEVFCSITRMAGPST
ncbi:Retrovirus-related Pol polyprotein from transposon TNT 1-94 [Vitis vinifera]|uniref:Retrovirus-related Pol polyprotein from transposon TNT 1-94 n=1 Tax=Vitis vinifera TaxID=29760 RepID=A0A438CSN7_VITVI|nr:Retrovirus-related Pol polyprotein from transposon TNT 1-94 [Vitis vinifera]